VARIFTTTSVTIATTFLARITITPKLERVLATTTTITTEVL
jgi:hypothetical protein